VTRYLGVDGGGTKTAFLVIDESGRVLATHSEGPAYYPEIGWDALRGMLARGIEATCRQAGLAPSAVNFSFLGLPAYGEDSRLVPALDDVAATLLPVGRYRCGNDALCGWAGALACGDGINIIAGTGSMAYGEFEGRTARAGGWGELFSDEGSAYWVASQGLALFSRMSDGRSERGVLYEVVRRHFALESDLDVCARIYGESPSQRSDLAALAPVIAQAATAGDQQAAALFTRAADEFIQMVRAVRAGLGVPRHAPLSVSYSGGMFQQKDLLLEPLRSKLADESPGYRLVAPRLPPAAGAALYAAKLAGRVLPESAVEVLAHEVATL
jgi:N-acetylglucosamine kinase-like BadF-type ATPase